MILAILLCVSKIIVSQLLAKSGIIVLPTITVDDNKFRQSFLIDKLIGLFL